MTNLIEVVFEQVKKTRIVQVLTRLTSDAERIVDIECAENVALLSAGQLRIEALSALLNFDCDLTVLIKLQDVKIDGAKLPSVLLRLVKYDNQFDIDFSFDVNEFKDIDMHSLMESLHSYAKNLAEEFSIGNFFCGMDPASDASTRFFTNQIAGPLNCL